MFECVDCTYDFDLEEGVLYHDTFVCDRCIAIRKEGVAE